VSSGSPHAICHDDYLTVIDDGKYEIDVKRLLSTREKQPTRMEKEGKYEIDLNALLRKTKL